VFDPGLAQWVKQRARRSKQGKPELVRIPITQRSMGWGCVCPEMFVGASPDVGTGPWLAVTWAEGASPPPAGRLGWVVLAEGYFTGEVEIEDHRAECDGCEEWLYKLQGFHALRFRQLRRDETEEGPSAQLILPDIAMLGTAQPRDERPWLVIAASIPKSQESARRARAVVEKLRAGGFASAAVLDSRLAPLLFCCFDLAVANRFATHEQAQAAMAKLRQKGFKPYARQGW
jgi:hypothetical protein